jgi:predicted nucleic acid-binding protein
MWKIVQKGKRTTDMLQAFEAALGAGDHSVTESIHPAGRPERLEPIPDGFRSGAVGQWLGTAFGAGVWSHQAEALKGKRRSALEAATATMFSEDFAGRVLPFDAAAASLFAEASARRRQSGRPVAAFDAMIAAIAAAHGAAVATRNIADFEDFSVRIIDPWA